MTWRQVNEDDEIEMFFFGWNTPSKKVNDMLKKMSTHTTHTTVWQPKVYKKKNCNSFFIIFVHTPMDSVYESEHTVYVL